MASVSGEMQRSRWLLCCVLGLARGWPGTVQLEPWCNHSIRLRWRPAGGPISDELPGALGASCGQRALPGRAVSSGNLRAEITDAGLLVSRQSDGASLFTAQLQRLNGSLPGASLIVRPPEKEYIYGLGQIEGGPAHGCPVDGQQRGLALIRNNQSFDLSTGKFKVSIPWLVSSRGYGLMVNHPGSGAVSVPAVGGSEWQVNDTVQLDLLVTTTVADAPPGRLDSLYRHYADATGHAPLLPDTATLFWQCRLRYRTSAEAESVAAGYGKLNVSVGVFVIDFFNQKVNGDFKMNPECYPNVSQMVQTIRGSTGAQTMVSLWPNVEQSSISHAVMAENKCIAGGVPGYGGSFVDPTSAACRELMWSRYIKPNYVDQGVHAFWLDETDFMKDKLHCGSASSCGRWWLNTWLQTFADGLKSEGIRPLILTRGYWLGAQRHGAVLWSSDIMSTWDELKAQVPEGIAAGLSGVPWWTTDVGGFGCPTSPYNNSSPYMQELIQRWYQFGALCPIFRTHGCRAGSSPIIPPSLPNTSYCLKGQGPNGACGPNEVWSYGESVQPVLLKYIHLRNVLLRPYLLELARNVTKYGAVTMRSLSFEFPLDDECLGIKDQFLLGPKYLVAPVVEQGAVERRLYFPKGAVWSDFWTGEVIPGGQWKTVDAPISVLPLFTRSL